MTAKQRYDAKHGEELEDGADRELPWNRYLAGNARAVNGFGRAEQMKLHLSLVSGDEKSAGQFLEAQNQILTELYPPEDMEGEAEENEEPDHSDKGARGNQSRGAGEPNRAKQRKGRVE